MSVIFMGLAFIIFLSWLAAISGVVTIPQLADNKTKLFTASFLLSLVGVVIKGTFYAEPGYVYHVRTVFGNEIVISDTGYKIYPLGRHNAWKRGMTVQALDGKVIESMTSESESKYASVSMPPLTIMFLDQVDAESAATVRFTIPTERTAFLKMAHEYRTPENLLRTALIPSFKETLQATASLMSAEDYYSGGRTEFNNEFETQMSNGIYIVKREERRVHAKKTTSTANASIDEQEEYGEGSKTTFIVRKMENEDGTLRVKSQNFQNYGVQVIEARITEMNPNAKFVERMQLKQKASADRAIAREQRVQEEEQRLLAIAKGDREIAERQAEAKVEQIAQTTAAETSKQLALTEAQKFLEEAEISKETAAVELEKATIEAETKRTIADAEAYQKEVILKADNALAQKLDAEIEIQRVWAEAYATRKVPQYVFGGTDGSTPTGGDGETQTFMQLMTVDAAKRLAYDRTLSEK